MSGRGIGRRTFLGGAATLGAGALALTSAAEAAIIPELGGTSSVLNVSSAKTLKAGPGRLIRFVCNAAAATTVTFNDCAATGDAAAGNVIYTNSAVTLGTVIELDWPCNVGITISAVGGGTFAVSIA